MRSLVLFIILLVGSPALGQQLKAITNSIGMNLVLIPAGTFTMGTPIGEQGRRDGETYYEVTISKSYYLSAYEVTQEQYEKVLGNNPSPCKGAKNPVDKVTWDEAVLFCTKLSEMPEEKAAGRVYRLQTEAEWEYACRAGSTTSYSFGDTAELLREYAWFGKNSERKTHPVGEKKANRWGLYDMHGNVWEWCQDSIEGSDRVVRGGSWDDDAGVCRSAYRGRLDPSGRYSLYGFRVALSPSVKSPEAEYKK